MTHPVARSCPRALPVTQRTGRQCRGALWSCRGALLVMSCLAMRACVLLCHDTIYYIVTQTEKWVVAHLVSLVQKYIYIYSHLPVEPKIFIIIFFPVLHTVQPQKRKFFFLNIIIFPLCYSSSIQAHINHQNVQWMHDLTRFPSSPRYLYT